MEGQCDHRVHLWHRLGVMSGSTKGLWGRALWLFEGNLELGRRCGFLAKVGELCMVCLPV
jgi:hypothetical protein